MNKVEGDPLLKPIALFVFVPEPRLGDEARVAGGKVRGQWPRRDQRLLSRYGYPNDVCDCWQVAKRVGGHSHRGVVVNRSCVGSRLALNLIQARSWLLVDLCARIPDGNL